MILFFILLSSLVSCMLSYALNKKLVEKYTKYNHSNLNYMMILAAIINLIVQFKLFDKINSTIIWGNKWHIVILITCCLLAILACSCLAVSSIIDILYFELPNELNLLIGISLIPVCVFVYSGKTIFTAIAIGLIYFLFAIFTDGFGMGDVKLAFALGFGIKFTLLFKFMFLSFLFASIFSIIKIVKHKENLKSEIAFGPFIVLSFLLFF